MFVRSPQTTCQSGPFECPRSAETRRAWKRSERRRGFPRRPKEVSRTTQSTVNAEKRTKNWEPFVHVAVNGGSEQLGPAESSVTGVEEEEEEDVGRDPPSPLTAAALVPVRWVSLSLIAPQLWQFPVNTGSKGGNLLTTTSHVNFAGADGELSGRDPIQVKILLFLYISTRPETIN